MDLDLETFMIDLQVMGLGSWGIGDDCWTGTHEDEALPGDLALVTDTCAPGGQSPHTLRSLSSSSSATVCSPGLLSSLLSGTDPESAEKTPLTPSVCLAPYLFLCHLCPVPCVALLGYLSS